MNKSIIKELMQIEIYKARALAIPIYLNKKRKYKRKCAVRSNLRERREKGYFCHLIPAMRITDSESFKNFHRMDSATFDLLLGILGPDLVKIPNRRQEKISPSERLSLTLRYLASGDSMKSIGFYGFRIGASTTSGIIRETCRLIWDKLQFVFPTPSIQMWEKITEDFEKNWGFPNCLGAIDGIHVIIQALPNSNSLTCNYKNSHSLVLMAVADANYKFIFVDIGALGRNSDGGIFKNSKLGNAILNNANSTHFPAAKNLPGTCTKVPFVFLGNEAFPLRPNLLRPYPGRNTGNLAQIQTIFNNRLSRARRVVENAFGILAQRFRIYRKPILASEETIINIIKATTALHNWLRDQAPMEYVLPDHDASQAADQLLQHNESDGLQPIRRTGSNNASNKAIRIRNEYANSFYNT